MTAPTGEGLYDAGIKVRRIMRRFKAEYPSKRTAEARQALRQLRGQTALLTPEPEHTLRFARLLNDLYQEGVRHYLNEREFMDAAENAFYDILGLTQVRGGHAIARERLLRIGFSLTGESNEAVDCEGFRITAVTLNGVPRLAYITLCESKWPRASVLITG